MIVIHVVGGGSIHLELLFLRGAETKFPSSIPNSTIICSAPRVESDLARDCANGPALDSHRHLAELNLERASCCRRSRAAGRHVTPRGPNRERRFRKFGGCCQLEACADQARSRRRSVGRENLALKVSSALRTGALCSSRKSIRGPVGACRKDVEGELGQAFAEASGPLQIGLDADSSMMISSSSRVSKKYQRMVSNRKRWGNWGLGQAVNNRDADPANGGGRCPEDEGNRFETSAVADLAQSAMATSRAVRRMSPSPPAL